MPAEKAPDRIRVSGLDRRNVEAELKAGPPPRNPHDLRPERVAGQLLAVRGGCERDPRIRMQMIHMSRIDESMHRRVDRRSRSTLAEEAMVERRDHLVFAIDPRIHVRERPQPVEPQHGEPRGCQRSEVTTRPFHPHQLDRLPRHRVDRGALRRRVAAGVIGVARVGSEAVRPGDQVIGGGAHAPHPAWVPPARSAAVRSR